MENVLAGLIIAYPSRGSQGWAPARLAGERSGQEAIEAVGPEGALHAMTTSEKSGSAGARPVIALTGASGSIGRHLRALAQNGEKEAE
ncbi:hypothetical protein ACTHPH_02220 [Paenibacillus pasadenensis]|uniref:hypothetical protein n=1 Tax=Paenibacillus TaxID=44249 RepID=UPI000FDA82A5|nr:MULTISPECIES: hypothetical protein [Paenibacillus]QGG56473.1 hypothetical protein GE073_13365 [Paenibacillus sp. B01]